MIQGTIILPAVRTGFKIEECKLRAFENRVLRRILWPKKNEVTGEGRRLRKKELHNQYQIFSQQE